VKRGMPIRGVEGELLDKAGGQKYICFKIFTNEK
jgi:hypothetical protein